MQHISAYQHNKNIVSGLKTSLQQSLFFFCIEDPAFREEERGAFHPAQVETMDTEWQFFCMKTTMNFYEKNKQNQ